MFVLKKTHKKLQQDLNILKMHVEKMQQNFPLLTDQVERVDNTLEMVRKECAVMYNTLRDHGFMFYKTPPDIAKARFNANRGKSNIVIDSRDVGYKDVESVCETLKAHDMPIYGFKKACIMVNFDRSILVMDIDKKHLIKWKKRFDASFSGRNWAVVDKQDFSIAV